MHWLLCTVSWFQQHPDNGGQAWPGPNPSFSDPSSHIQTTATLHRVQGIDSHFPRLCCSLLRSHDEYGTVLLACLFWHAIGIVSRVFVIGFSSRLFSYVIGWKTYPLAQCSSLTGQSYSEVSLNSVVITLRKVCTGLQPTSSYRILSSVHLTTW